MIRRFIPFICVLFALAIRPDLLAQTNTLPNGFQHMDIGQTGVTGTVAYDSSSGTYTVHASGSNLWGIKDGFHYIYLPLDGDGMITARVVSIHDDHPNTFAGVMIRETLDKSSRYLFAGYSTDQKSLFKARHKTGKRSGGRRTSPKSNPTWIRLIRTGRRITSYRSLDGIKWYRYFGTNIRMGAHGYIGLVTSTIKHGQAIEYQFDNVSVVNTAAKGFTDIAEALGEEELYQSEYELSQDPTWVSSNLRYFYDQQKLVIEGEELTNALQVTVYSVSGQEVTTQEVYEQSLAQIPLGQLTSGVYIVSVRGNNWMTTHKIIKR